METKTNKGVKFATIISIIIAITSLLYLIVALIYFISMISTLMFGNEYEMLGFIFGLIGLPIALAALAIPVFRIAILVCSLILSKKEKKGINAKGLKAVTGIMHILDAVGSPIIYVFITSILYLLSVDSIQSVLGDGQIFSLFYAFLGFVLGMPVLAKGIIQIVSSVVLFRSIKQ